MGPRRPWIVVRHRRQHCEGTGDNQIRDLFHIASALHQNFYEMWLYREDVEAALANVRLFITKVDATFPPNESPGD